MRSSESIAGRASGFRAVVAVLLKMVCLGKAKPPEFGQPEVCWTLPFLGRGIAVMEDVHPRLVAKDGEQPNDLFLHKQLVHPEFESPPGGGGGNWAGF